MSRGLRALLLARREEIGHPDPALATDFVLEQLASMIQRRLDEPFPGPLAARPDEAFVREALRSACAYLQVEPPPDLEESP